MNVSISGYLSNVTVNGIDVNDFVSGGRGSCGRPNQRTSRSASGYRAGTPANSRSVRLPDWLQVDLRPHRSGRSARPWADRVHGDRRVVDARRWLERKVNEAGRDERTRLRFSRISIARCADLIRCSASAWGPLSWLVHPRTGARATDLRPLRTGPSAGGTQAVRRNSFALHVTLCGRRHPAAATLSADLRGP